MAGGGPRRDYKEGTQLVLEISSSKAEKTPPKTLQGSRQNFEGIKEKEGDREGKTNPLAIPSIYSTKEESRRTPLDPRSLTIKYVHKLPIIQDANRPGDQVPTPKGILDCFSGSPGRLLAHPYRPIQTPIHGLQIQGPVLPVSCVTFRTMCRSESFYKSNVTCSESPGRSGYLVSPVPGRPSADCTNKRGVQSDCAESPGNYQQIGTTCEREEVTTYTRSAVRVARHRLGSTCFHSTSSRREAPMPSGESEVNHNFEVLNKEDGDEGTRIMQLDRTERPQYTASHVHDKNNTEGVLKISSRHTHTNSKESEDEIMRLDQGNLFSSTARVTKTRFDHPDGRESVGMGDTYKPDVLQRQIRPVNGVLHQRQGNVDNLVCTSDGVTGEYHNSDTLRQLVCTTSTEERRVNDLPPVLLSGIDLEESGCLQLDSQNIPHSGDIQRPGRSALEGYATVHGMDSHNSGFPENSQDKPKPTGGSFRYKAEQQARDFCVTLSGSDGGSSERSCDTLGRVGSPLHVPTNSITFEGFESTDPILIQKRNSDYSRYTHKTMVHDTSITVRSVNTNRSHTTTGSDRQGRSPTQSYKTSRVAVIRRAYQERLKSSQRTINLLSEPIRQSSINDYQVKWKKFCSYMTKHDITPDQLSLGDVLDFLDHLFEDKGLLPSTVAHYRSSLTVPLKLAFQIDLNDSAVSQLLRAMKIKRPNTPVTAPVWSLNKVLEHLDNLPNRIPLATLLQKTAFLLLLSTGYRLSELHACVREEEFCSISKDLKLSLRPHSSFLAKNECPQKRWTHKTISTLRLQDGSVSNLCPVKSLSEYLRRTSRITRGKLLIHPSTQEALSMHQLGTFIRKLIWEADPVRGAKPHDVRKYASSYSFSETMDVTGVINALRWKSPHTFFKFYMCALPPLSHTVSLPQTHQTMTNMENLRSRAASSYEEVADDQPGNSPTNLQKCS